MTRKLMNYVFVGSDADLEALKTRPAILHAAKEPWHRKFVGYVSRGAPKESPEYLYAVRYEYMEMALNLVDVDDPAYVNKDLMEAAVNFVNYHRCKQRNVFIHCNQGLSRAPTVGMLAIAPSLHPDFYTSVKMFQELYPEWAPKDGVYKFAEQNWSHFFGQLYPEDEGASPDVKGPLSS